jgi:hypothetical protein
VAVVYHRRADLDAAARILREGRVVLEYSMGGVWLARLVALPHPATVGPAPDRADPTPRRAGAND